MKISDMVILITGSLCFFMAFISEWYFHIYLEFMPNNPAIPEDVFWKAEYGEVFNSMTFLTLGVILIAIGVWLVRKRRSCLVIPTNFCLKYF